MKKLLNLLFKKPTPTKEDEIKLLQSLIDKAGNRYEKECLIYCLEQAILERASREKSSS